MQFNELKATVMDYIWLIRDSLSANNAIYFQFTIFFSAKPGTLPQTMKDSSEQLTHPFLYGWDTEFFMGWTMNSSCYSFISNFAMFPRG